MTDIVTRLRALADALNFDEPSLAPMFDLSQEPEVVTSDALREAADALERMQVHVDSVERLAAAHSIVLQERDAARAEAARYREALAFVREAVEANEGNWFEPYCDVNPEDCDHCAVVGRIDDALSQPGPGAALLERQRKVETAARGLMTAVRANRGGFDAHVLCALDDLDEALAALDGAPKEGG